MPVLKNDKHKEYAQCAMHCLQMVAAAGDQESRSIQREMAAERLNLAEVVAPPSKQRKIKRK